MPKYKVISPLDHNGEPYPIGSTVDMSEKQAETLLGHTLALPGQSLDEKQVAQGVKAVQEEAMRLDQARDQLTEEQVALKEAQDKLDADRKQFEADRALQSKGGDKK